VVQLVEALRYKPGRSRVRFLIVSLEIFIDLILPAALWPWSQPNGPGVDPASNRNEDQVYPLWVKGTNA
jgi:hypothetical protein